MASQQWGRHRRDQGLRQGRGMKACAGENQRTPSHPSGLSPENRTHGGQGIETPPNRAHRATPQWGRLLAVRGHPLSRLTYPNENHHRAGQTVRLSAAAGEDMGRSRIGFR